MKEIKRMLFGIALILFGCLSPFTLITATDGVGAVGLIIAFIGLFVAFLALTAPIEKSRKAQSDRGSGENGRLAQFFLTVRERISKSPLQIGAAVVI